MKTLTHRLTHSLTHGFRLVLALAFLGVATLAPAQDYFTLTGTAQGATNSYAIVPKHLGVPCVFFVDASVFHLDNTNSVLLKWQTGEAQRLVTRAGTTGTNTIYVAATNGLVVGDVIVLSRNAETAFERHTVSAISSTNLTITGTTAGLTVPGDKIYRMTVAGQVRYQDVTVAHGGTPGTLRLTPGSQPYFSGPEGRPALIEIGGTLTNTLNTVSGRWLPTTLER